MKYILILILFTFTLSSIQAEERECYPWKLRVVPYLNTQIEFYNIYLTSFREGKISANAKEVNISNLISNFRQSRVFVAGKKSCPPPKGVSEAEKQAFLQKMDEILQAMSQNLPVKSL